MSHPTDRRFGQVVDKLLNRQTPVESRMPFRNATRRLPVALAAVLVPGEET
jgi:hypothetical protein